MFMILLRAILFLLVIAFITWMVGKLLKWSRSEGEDLVDNIKQETDDLERDNAAADEAEAAMKDLSTAKKKKGGERLKAVNQKFTETKDK